MNTLKCVRVGAIALIAALSLCAAGAATTLPIRVSIGGAGAGPFVADTSLPYLTETGADNITTVPEDINVSKVKDAAPKAVYQSVRWGADMTFAFSGLTPKANYSVRIHFAEVYYDSVGQRIFDVLINQKAVLSQFDILKDAGGKDIADIKTFDAVADDSGKIVIETMTSKVGGVDFASISGIEILETHK